MTTHDDVSVDDLAMLMMMIVTISNLPTAYKTNWSILYALWCDHTKQIVNKNP